jgi:hypothetical protein
MPEENMLDEYIQNVAPPGAVDAHRHVTHPSKRLDYAPSKGERLERRGLGLTLRGTVLYVDRVQVLVKWDNGRSSSLRLGVDDLDLIYAQVSSRGSRQAGDLTRNPPYAVTTP